MNADQSTAPHARRTRNLQHVKFPRLAWISEAIARSLRGRGRPMQSNSQLDVPLALSMFGSQGVATHVHGSCG